MIGRRRGRLQAALAIFAALAAASLSTGARAADDDLSARIDRSLELGARWLAAQQADDGGWHSAVYGQMRGGAGNSAQVVVALARLPHALRTPQDEHIERGLRFLLGNLDPSGHVRDPGGSADYPTFATALTLTALASSDSDFPNQAGRLREYLLATQQSERLPWEHDDANVGAWGLVGGDPSDPSSLRDANLSATRWAIAALAASGGVPDEVATRAVEYVTRLQNPDGGFRFVSDVNDPLNKAGLTGAHADSETSTSLSYGTTTADGLCTLIDCGVPLGDARVQAAITWLDDHQELSVVPGFAEPQSARDESSARDGLRFYYFAALASAMTRAPDAPFAQRRPALAKQVLRLQRPDGSWTNGSAQMREDDPLIATSWAILALAQVR